MEAKQRKKSKPYKKRELLLSVNTTTEEYIALARAKWGDRYGYDGAKFKAPKEGVWVTCFKHGSWLAKPRPFLDGKGCSECAYDLKRMPFKVALARVIEVHGDTYDYSKFIEMYDGFEYIKNNSEKIPVLCRDHGVQWMRISHHIEGVRCKKCAGRRKMSDEYLAECKAVCPQYDYSEAIFTGSNDPIRNIRCHRHGLFDTPRAASHKYGKNGCKFCSGQFAAAEDFASKAEAVHGVGRYVYDRVKYVTAKIDIEIYCTVHKRYFPQTPTKHLDGSGCPTCAESTGERAIRLALTSMGVEYIPQWTHTDCRNEYPLAFDFCIEGLKLLYEHDGLQHESPVEHFGGQEAYLKTVLRDSIKNAWARDNGYTLVRITHRRIDQIPDIVRTVNEWASLNPPGFRDGSVPHVSAKFTASIDPECRFLLFDRCLTSEHDALGNITEDVLDGGAHQA